MRKRHIIWGIALLGTLALTSCKKDKEKDIETPTASNMIYVAPGGDTSDNNDGTNENNPLAFTTATRIAKPGDTLLLKGGTYKYNARIQLESTGKANQYITVKPQKEEERVIFDFSEQTFNGSNRGIQVYGDYWHFKNIEITGAGDNGMYIAGSFNIIEECSFYNNRDTGLQIGRAYASDTTIESWPAYNLIKNCTSFANYDAETFGENADGFAAKLTVGYGNVFDGCIAFRNSDDGWDLYAKEDSGNIGTVALYNCVSFENGFLPYQIDRTNSDETVYKSYNTMNGDGIGFKLGGSTMEGDVILNNCLAFNNKLHGFGDNSNPGVINIKNCSAINNCIGLEENGNVSPVRGVEGIQNKSNNFDLARDTKSYNTYYGLLSYINNQTGFDVSAGDSSYNKDAFRGSVAYSIFQTQYSGGEIYKAFTGYEDASSYSSATVDSAFSGGTDYTGLTDASFASLSSINAKCESVEKISDLLSLDKRLRNEDGSVNVGDVCKVVDSKLLTYANGKPIGANLSLTKSSDYPHYDLIDFKDCKNEDEVSLQAAYNALEILGAQDSIYQDFEVSKLIQGCEISWVSSHPEILEIQKEEKFSVSNSVFSAVKVISPATETKVTLTATITLGERSKEKKFDVIVKGRNQSLGELVSSDSKAIRIDLYGKYIEPRIYPIDASSNTGTELPLNLYDLERTYRYATDGNSKYNEVDGVYTSVPGVYEVTATAILKSDKSIKSSYTYNVYIVDPDCNIDFKNSSSVVTLNKDGFNISGNLSNIYGDVYAVVSPTELTLTKEELLNHPDVQKFAITTDSVVASFLADNTTGQTYYGYYLVSNHNQSNDAQIYTFQTDVQTISTKEEFKNLASTGKKGSETPTTTTIYNLTCDLDFTDFEWSIPTKTEAQAFRGLFNGNDYTISNINIDGASADKTINVFFKVQNGTIMDVKFDHITLINRDTAAGKQVGIIGDLQGGYVHNVKMTNISAKGREGVAALVGQATGGDNYISQCSLVNPIPENAEDNQYVISASNKYAGGIVGNGQKNSDQSIFRLTVTDCMVKAIIGDGKDAGGNTGGIVGRVKNESSIYYTSIERCYFQGIVIAKGNYNAGIIGDFDAGLGYVSIHHNFSDVAFIFDGTYLDAYVEKANGTSQQYAHKNTNAIVGRSVWAEGGIYETGENFGTWAEYYSQFITSVSIVFDLAETDELTGEFNWVITKAFIENRLTFDLENVWEFNETTLEITLR